MFLFGYNDVRAFEVCKCTAGCIFKCGKPKVMLAKNIKNGFLRKKFLYNVILSQILMLLKFLKISYIPL